MDKAASIFLRSEIEPEDIRCLARWLRSSRVTRYLNEQATAPDELEALLASTPAPLLTCRLNRAGRFFMICRNWGSPIGFVKLTPGEKDGYEVVFAVGEEGLWGNGYGTRALRSALREVFFHLRGRLVTARIFHGNDRSRSAVRSCGFTCLRRAEKLDLYALTLEEYLELLSGGESAVQSLA